MDEKEIKTEIGGHTDAAVSLTHLPTGITASIWDSSSLDKNKQCAKQLLNSSVYSTRLRQWAPKDRGSRISHALYKEMIKRHEIRAYKYLQKKVTDHRTGFTTMDLENVLDGKGLEEIIESCRRKHREKVLRALLEDAEKDKGDEEGDKGDWA